MPLSAFLRLLFSFFFLLSLAYAQRLAPGDKIRIVCEQEPTLSVERILGPTGDATLPLLGRVILAGKSITEAESELERLAGAKLRSDYIVIAIALIPDESRPIEFAGAVTRSGTVPYHSGMTLQEVVKLAEPSVAAATEAVEITGSDGSKWIVDLTRNGGATKLRPGDRVFFPRAEGSSDVIILGGVVRPGSKPYNRDLTLRGLVELAGGITGHGQSGKIRLERKGQPARTIDIDSSDGALKLERGDVVVVPLVENGRFVTVAGFINHPGLIEFREGMTLSQAVQAAGGLSMLAGPEAISVKRVGEWKRRFDLAKIGAGKEKDLVLKAGDTIEVPSAKPRPVEPPIDPKKRPKSHPVVPPR
ncbi:MAG: polysaccharide biosynthesis/export family protein [Fimbriimonadales bacterium]